MNCFTIVTARNRLGDCLMETHVRTPQDVFMQPQHLVVPPFQRPYVWEKEEQWAPLWQDVRRLADLRLEHSSADARHFLGAIVVQAQEPILGDLQASSIIDGQQRLTTLQVLMDATAAALEAVGQDALAGQLDRLTHNEDIYVPGARTRGSSSATATRIAMHSTR